MNKLERIVKNLKLEPLLGEGGLWARACQTNEILKANTLQDMDTDHLLYSSIYYLMTQKTFSHMHVLKNDELWFYHDGEAIEMLLVHPDCHSEVVILGPDVEKGERPQVLCRRGTFQGSHMNKEGEYSLVSCVNIPGYEDDDFSVATFDQLEQMLSDVQHVQLLKMLTGEIEF